MEPIRLIKYIFAVYRIYYSNLVHYANLFTVSIQATMLFLLSCALYSANLVYTADSVCCTNSVYSASVGIVALDLFLRHLQVYNVNDRRS